VIKSHHTTVFVRSWCHFSS